MAFKDPLVIFPSHGLNTGNQVIAESFSNGQIPPFFMLFAGSYRNFALLSPKRRVYWIEECLLFK